MAQTCLFLGHITFWEPFIYEHTSNKQLEYHQPKSLAPFGLDCVCHHASYASSYDDVMFVRATVVALNFLID